MARLPLLPSGPGLKRWFMLLALSLVLTAFALSGLVGQIFSGWRVNVVSPATLDRWTRQVQSLRFIDFSFLATGIWGLVFALRRLYFTVLTVAGTRDPNVASV